MSISEILTTCDESSPSRMFYPVALTRAILSISKEASVTRTKIRARQVLTSGVGVTYGTWGIALVNIYQGNANL